MAGKQTFTFPSSDGVTDIHAVLWTPDTQPRGIVQITHGMIEYIDRYDAFARFLASQGFVVAGSDLLGHGDSVLSQELWGYIGYGKHPEHYLIKDMHRLRTIVAKQYAADLPYFMLGHSFGSYLLRAYLAVHGEGLSGALLLGTGYEKPVVVRFVLTLAHLLALLHFGNWRYHSKLIRDITMTAAYHKFDLTGNDKGSSWLTRDEAVVEAYYREPRCQFLFTLNGYRALLQTVLFVCTQSNAARIPQELPLFVVSGEDDPVGNLGKGVRQSYAMLEKAGIADLTLKLYPGYRHELLNETGREAVYADLLAWISDRIKPAGCDNAS